MTDYFALWYFKYSLLAYGVKHYIEMEGISCPLDFDPIHQSDWLESTWAVQEGSLTLIAVESNPGL